MCAPFVRTCEPQVIVDEKLDLRNSCRSSVCLKIESDAIRWTSFRWTHKSSISYTPLMYWYATKQLSRSKGPGVPVLACSFIEFMALCRRRVYFNNAQAEDAILSAKRSLREAAIADLRPDRHITVELLIPLEDRNYSQRIRNHQCLMTCIWTRVLDISSFTNRLSLCSKSIFHSKSSYRSSWPTTTSRNICLAPSQFSVD